MHHLLMTIILFASLSLYLDAAETTTCTTRFSSTKTIAPKPKFESIWKSKKYDASMDISLSFPEDKEIYLKLKSKCDGNDIEGIWQLYRDIISADFNRPSKTPWLLSYYVRNNSDITYDIIIGFFDSTYKFPAAFKEFIEDKKLPKCCVKNSCHIESIMKKRLGIIDYPYPRLIIGYYPKKSEVAYKIVMEYFDQKANIPAQRKIILESTLQPSLPKKIQVEYFIDYFETFINTDEYEVERDIFLRRCDNACEEILNEYNNAPSYSPDNKYRQIVESYYNIISSLQKDKNCPIELITIRADRLFENAAKVDDPNYIPIHSHKNLLFLLNKKKAYEKAYRYALELLKFSYTDNEKSFIAEQGGVAAYMLWDMDNAIKLWQYGLHMSSSSRNIKMYLKEYNKEYKAGFTIKQNIDKMQSLLDQKDFQNALNLANENIKLLNKSRKDAVYIINHNCQKLEYETYELMACAAMALNSNKDIEKLINFISFLPQLTLKYSKDPDYIQKLWDYSVRTQNIDFQKKLKCAFRKNLETE